MTETTTANQGPIVGEDGLARCPWATTHLLNRDYHDTEWGLPVRGEQGLFERIMLEAFQSGLSWLTILAKRPAFRDAFANFDPDIVADLTDHDMERLMHNAAIVRNRAKIQAARTNACATIALRKAGGLDTLVWSHQPAETASPTSLDEVSSKTLESKALADDLRAHGFVFVGPTTAYALMSAIGVVDLHLVGCHRRGSSGLF